MNRRADVRAFVVNLLMNKGDDKPVADHDPLFLTGRLQSIDAVDIVIFLEEQWGIDFARGRFTQEEIDSIDAICTLIQKTTGRWD
jgi:acyl carrier protein